MAEEDFDDLEQPVLPEEPGGQEQPPPGPTLSDRVQDAQGRVDRAGDYRDRFRDWRAARAQKKAAKQGLRGVEQKGVEAAKRKVATRVEGEAAKQAAKKVAVQAGAKVGTTLAAEAAAGPVGWVAGAITVLTSLKSFLLPAVKKIWPYVVYIIAVLLILPAIIFALLAKPPITPGNAAQKQQTTLVASIGGDPIATRQITADVVTQEKRNYANLINSAKGKFPSQAAAAQKRADEIIALMEQLINLQGEPKKTLLAQILVKRVALAKDFPEIFAAGGNCGQLAPYIYSGQFKIGDAANRREILQGKLYNGDDQLQPASQDMCQALLFGLRAGYKIMTNTFSHGHGKQTVSNKRSLHWCGAAIDINAINGKPVTDSSPDAIAISKLWFEASQNRSVFIQELIVPTSYNQYEVKENAPLRYGAAVQAVHSGSKAHIHLGGRLAPGACQ